MISIAIEMVDEVSENMKRKLDDIIRKSRERNKILVKILKELEDKRKLNNML